MSGFEKINIVDIKPSNYNPRKISDTEYDKLSQSINEFGVISPIIINLRTNHIIGGHQRYDVLYDKYTSTGEYSELNLIKSWSKNFYHTKSLGKIFLKLNLEYK